MSKCRVILTALGLGLVVMPSTSGAAPPVLGAAPRAESPPAESVYVQEGLLGPVRVGPTIGGGVPDGFRFGAFAKWRGLLAGGGAFSYLPELTVPGVGAQVTRMSGEAFVRIHPLRGAFFVGIAGGYVRTEAALARTKSVSGRSQLVATEADASSLFLAPHLGFQWMFPFGMTAGFDIGVEIPIAPSGPSFRAASGGAFVPVEGTGKVADAMRTATTTPVPVIHVLELGYAL